MANVLDPQTLEDYQELEKIVRRDLRIAPEVKLINAIMSLHESHGHKTALDNSIEEAYERGVRDGVSRAIAERLANS